MSMTTGTILVAEEHDATRAFLADNLTADGYRVLVAPDRPAALVLLSTAHPDLILVDVNGQTLALLDTIRCGDGLTGGVDPDTPLIVLSRDADRLQRIRVLERGGDDVVRKPFAYPELRARIAALLRRSQVVRGAGAARRSDRDRRSLAGGASVRPTGRVVSQGVPVADHARGGADAGIHARGAVAQHLGAGDVRAHPDAR
jgi:DNA-binding response OmpR family regulator